MWERTSPRECENQSRRHRDEQGESPPAQQAEAQVSVIGAGFIVRRWGQPFVAQGKQCWPPRRFG